MSVVRRHFPGGQLFARVPRPAVTSMRLVEVLGGFLTDLGIKDHDMPVDEAAMIALYQELVADRRVLVTLDVDDITDVAGLHPLLRVSGGSAVVINCGDRSGPSILLTERLTDASLAELLAAITGPEAKAS